jgi:hypothetical protein
VASRRSLQPGISNFRPLARASYPKFIQDVGGLAAGMLKSQLGCVGGLTSGTGKDEHRSRANGSRQVHRYASREDDPFLPARMGRFNHYELDPSSYDT